MIELSKFRLYLFTYSFKSCIHFFYRNEVWIRMHYEHKFELRSPAFSEPFKNPNIKFGFSYLPGRAAFFHLHKKVFKLSKFAHLEQYDYVNSDHIETQLLVSYYEDGEKDAGYYAKLEKSFVNLSSAEVFTLSQPVKDSTSQKDLSDIDRSQYKALDYYPKFKATNFKLWIAFIIVCLALTVGAYFGYRKYFKSKTNLNKSSLDLDKLETNRDSLKGKPSRKPTIRKIKKKSGSDSDSDSESESEKKKNKKK